MAFEVTSLIAKHIHTIQVQCPLIFSILEKINSFGGRALLVGGAVRDIFLHIQSQDLDIEVYGLSLEQLQTLLSQFGLVHLVGKSFGVFRLHNLDVDWSLPRSDSVGRKPQVIINQNLSFKEAFARRDLTINAMGIDLVTQELIDPFNGLQDLHNKILRAPDVELFVQDPLRLFRVMQFIGRFEMVSDESLAFVCRSMDISGVSKERIVQEFEKLLLYSKRPSLGFRWLQKIQRLAEVLPELYNLIGVMQRSDYHPEGDVFEHTMQTVDAAACIACTYSSDVKKIILLYAALCHDLGKKNTTCCVEGVWRSPGHAQAGVPLARALLYRCVEKKEIITAVLKLVLHHMMPGELVKNGARLSRYKHLAHKLWPEVTMKFLADLACADRQGRNPDSSLPLSTQDQDIDLFVRNASEAGVLHAPEFPILCGTDLLKFTESGPKIGRLLERAYQIQIDEEIIDKNKLLKRVLR